jgi:pyruvate/2-oxoacid:ferredoxin oxidoreductase beta subunit
MAKVRITHPDTGVVYVVDVNNLTEEDLKRLERLNIAEEVEEKPKRKKKYKNVEQKKDEQPKREDDEKEVE